MAAEDEILWSLPRRARSGWPNRAAKAVLARSQRAPSPVRSACTETTEPARLLPPPRPDRPRNPHASEFLNPGETRSTDVWHSGGWHAGSARLPAHTKGFPADRHRAGGNQ